MPRNNTSQLSANLLIALYFANKMVPVIVSGFSIYLGYKLFILGVTGKASLSIAARSVSAQLINAAPGLFFAVGGLVGLSLTVWKGTSFTFTRQVPKESWAMCMPLGRNEPLEFSLIDSSRIGDSKPRFEDRVPAPRDPSLTSPDI